MKYAYSGTPRGDSSRPWFFRPMLPLEVFRKEKSIRIVGLVDSGADQVLMNAEIAEFLGVDLVACRFDETIGIDGVPQTVYETALDIQITDLKRIKIPVYFMKGLPVPCLLGQEGFFDAYRIKFERDHKTFEITPTPKKK